MPRTSLAYGNEEVAAVLEEIADLSDLKGENPFRAVTFRAAARAIRDLREPLRVLMEQKRLDEIPKVGPAIAEAIEQLLTTGTSTRHQQLTKEVPAGLLTLLSVPGVGPATARVIYDNLKITTIDDLEEAAKAGRLRSLPKIQAKTEENILRSIASLRQRTGRSLLIDARAAANEIVAYLREKRDPKLISVTGSVRRWRETIGDVDVLVAAAAAGPIMKAFCEAPSVERVLARGETKSSILVARGLQIDLRVVPPASWGAALMYFTGSKEHNVRLRGLALKRKLLLNEYGLFRVGEEKTGNPIASRTEEEVFAALGMDWIPPELREDRGEVDAALAHGLPRLVALSDIRGDLHAHTSWTDGRDTVAAMAERARAKGYEYLALTDHSVGLGMTHGLNAERIRERTKEIAAVNEKMEPFRILVGTEVEIRSSGKLDYDEKTLASFEVVTASVHSAFSQEREVMTKRIVGAMGHARVNAISHPTGRLLERRDPYEVDLEAVIAAAVRTKTRLEVNGGPERLDLSDVAVRRAIDAGVMLVCNSDAHAVEELDQMEYAVATARRGWATKARVQNAMPLTELLRHLEGKG
ncbi:MAG: DNA polymerase/3'-5' exonuclease PolX [Chloroflexota bacterium]|nr:DNA polymerase/3'-5' exonuclease PolX [Chloroflexota bacterium]